MNEEQLDVLVATAAIAQERLDRLVVADEVAELKETIMASPTLLESVNDPSTQRRGWRTIPAAAAAAVIALALLLVAQPFGNNNTGAWATVLVEAAEDSPLLLVTEPGWGVQRADIHGGVGDVGQMTFVNGDAKLDLDWRDGDEFDSWVADRVHESRRVDELTVLGHDATLVEYAAGGHFTTLFHDGRWTIEVRGTFADEATYRALLGSLTVVDVDTWLSAMPDSVIASADRPGAVRQMLADIPLPDGFDAAALEEGPLRDHYQLGATVSSAVACAWIEQWIDAQAAGDATAADEAVAALASSHDWTILAEMEEQGGHFSRILWDHADAVVAGGGLVPAGREMTVEESFRNAFSCDVKG